MTPEQREAVREVLSEMVHPFNFDDTAALNAIAAIMEPQWLPVAGLVRDGRNVVAAGWMDSGKYCKTAIVRAESVQCWTEYTHYAELPLTLPDKHGESDVK